MSLTLAGILVLAAIAGAAQPAAANPFSDALSDNDEDEDSLVPDLDTITAGAQGFIDRVGDTLNGDDTSADEAAEEATKAFNGESDELLAYVNDRAEADKDFEVLEVTFEVDDETDVRYMVADANETAGDYESLQLVDEETFEGMDREVDETVTLRDSAAENADEEIDRFVTEYASEDRDVDGAYLAHLGARYGSVSGDDLIDASFEVHE